MRDDRGYRNRIEEHVERRTSVAFTHGLCADRAAAPGRAPCRDAVTRARHGAGDTAADDERDTPASGPRGAVPATGTAPPQRERDRTRDSEAKPSVPVPGRLARAEAFQSPRGAVTA